jgi:hypothetical protein
VSFVIFISPMRILVNDHRRRLLFPSHYCLSSCYLASAIAILVLPIWSQNRGLVKSFLRSIQIGGRSIRWQCSATNAINDVSSSPDSVECGFNYPLSWESILQIISTNRLHCLRRSTEQQKIYLQYLDEMKIRWVHPVDHILHTKFQFERVAIGSEVQEKEDSSIRYEASPKLHQVSEPIIKLCPNDFPYHLDANVKHWVLWKLLEPISHHEIHEAKQKLRNQHKLIVDIAHWVNPPNLKSIPEIDHVHIVCLFSSSLDI